MMKEDYFLLGTFLKNHGYNGEIVLKSTSSLSRSLNIMESLFLLIDGILVPFFIQEIYNTGSNTYILKLEDINNKNDANKLLGKYVYGPKDLFTPQEERESHLESLIGYEIFSELNKKAGIIRKILPIPGNLLFVVDFEGKEIMIPANLELVIEVNKNEKFICMKIPPGLLPE